MTREQEIVAAAAKVFMEKGYHHATIDDIAKTVGMLKGSLYYHIRSKQELLYKVLMEPSNAATTRLREVREAKLPALEKVRQAIHALIDHYDSNYPHMFVFLGEKLDQIPEEMRAQTAKDQRNYDKLWREIIEEGVASGELRQDLDPKMIAFAILGMCGWMHRWYDKAGRFSADEIAEMFSSMILRGIAEPNTEFR